MSNDTTLGRIYGLSLVDDDKIRYVGQTSQTIEKRLAQHRAHRLEDVDHYCVRRWIKKHGPQSIKTQLLEECSIEIINERESYWIEKLETHATRGGLNLTLGGEGTRGWSDERKARQAEKMRKWYESEEFKRKRAELWADPNSAYRQSLLANMAKGHTRESTLKGIHTRHAKKGETRPNCPHCPGVVDSSVTIR